MNFNIRNWLGYQKVDSKKWFTNSGNGKAVPEYELRNGSLVLLLDKKSGEIITHNLYNDIQADAHVNDYLKILKDNPNALDNVRLSIDNGKIPVVNGYDYTQLGSFDDLVQASQKLKDLGYSTFDDVIKAKSKFDEINKVFNESKKSVEKESKVDKKEESK